MTPILDLVARLEEKARYLERVGWKDGQEHPTDGGHELAAVAVQFQEATTPKMILDLCAAIREQRNAVFEEARRRYCIRAASPRLARNGSHIFTAPQLSANSNPQPKDRPC